MLKRLLLCLVLLLAACGRQDVGVLEPAVGTRTAGDPTSVISGAEGSSDSDTPPIGGDPTAVLATVAVTNTATPLLPTPITPTEAPEFTITPPAPTRVLTTGIPEVDQVTAVVLSNDFEARRDLVRLATAGCTHELGMGGPPKCEPDQAEGTPIDYFPVLGPGEGMHVFPEAIDDLLDFEVDALFAVYRRTAQQAADEYFPSGAYGLIFTTGQEENATANFLFHVDEDGKIVRLDYMVWPLDTFMDLEPGEWLVEPPPSPYPESNGAGASATPTPLPGEGLVEPPSTPYPESNGAGASITRTPLPGEGPGKILSFSVTSDGERPGPGDGVELSWQTVGGTTDICIDYGSRSNYECFDVPASGQQTYFLRTEDPVADHWVNFNLRVHDGFSGDHEEVRLLVKCQQEWFQENLSNWCPYVPVQMIEATVQEFEGGLAITTGTVSRVLFEEPDEACRDYDAGQNLAKDAILPESPSGLYPPGKALAFLWQGRLPGTEDLQERLGWAISRPESYLMKAQCEHAPEGQGSCYMMLPDGRVYSPDVMAGVPELDGISYDDGVCRWVLETE